MAKQRDQKKMAFYKKMRKNNPSITDKELLKNWTKIKEPEVKTV